MTYAGLKPVLAHEPGRVTVSDLTGKLEDNHCLFKSVQAALCGMKESLKKSVFDGCVQKYLELWGEHFDRNQTLTSRSQFILQLSIAFIDEFLVSYGTDDFSFLEGPTTQILDKKIRILQDISKKADRFYKHAISLKLDFLLLKEDVSEFSGNMRQEFDTEKTAFVKKTKESIDALNNKARTQFEKGAISSVVSDIGMDMVASGFGAPLGACLWVGGAIATYAYTGKALMSKWDSCKEKSIVKEADVHNKTVVDGLESCKETIKDIGERLEKFAERWKEMHVSLEEIKSELEFTGPSDFDNPALLEMLDGRLEILVSTLMDMRELAEENSIRIQERSYTRPQLEEIIRQEKQQRMKRERTANAHKTSLLELSREVLDSDEGKDCCVTASAFFALPEVAVLMTADDEEISLVQREAARVAFIELIKESRQRVEDECAAMLIDVLRDEGLGVGIRGIGSISRHQTTALVHHATAFWGNSDHTCMFVDFTHTFDSVVRTLHTRAKRTFEDPDMNPQAGFVLEEYRPTPMTVRIAHALFAALPLPPATAMAQMEALGAKFTCRRCTKKGAQKWTELVEHFHQETVIHETCTPNRPDPHDLAAPRPLAVYGTTA